LFVVCLFASLFGSRIYVSQIKYIRAYNSSPGELELDTRPRPTTNNVSEAIKPGKTSEIEVVSGRKSLAVESIN